MNLIIAQRGTSLAQQKHFDSRLNVMSISIKGPAVIIDVTKLLESGDGFMISRQRKPLVVTAEKSTAIHVIDDDGTPLFEHVF